MTKLGKFLSIIILLSVAAITLYATQPAEQVGIVTIECPPEPVKREGMYMVAKQIKATIKVDFGNGNVYSGTVVFPDCKVRRTGVGTMLVDAVTAKGTVK